MHVAEEMYRVILSARRITNAVEVLTKCEATQKDMQTINKHLDRLQYLIIKATTETPES